MPAGVDHRMTRQQYIAVLAIGSHDHRAGDGDPSCSLRQILHLVRLRGAIVFGVDFLQADDIGIELIKDLGNPRRAAPAIHADALVNVVANDREQRCWLGIT